MEYLFDVRESFLDVRPCSPSKACILCNVFKPFDAASAKLEKVALASPSPGIEIGFGPGLKAEALPHFPPAIEAT